MLVLQRDKSTNVLIYVPGMEEPIEVVVVRDGPSPKLGFRAPQNVRIVRGELEQKEDHGRKVA